MEIPDPIKESLERIGGLQGIASTLPSEETTARLAKVFQALSDPLRIKILLIVSTQPLCVCLIKELCSVPDSKLSYHLSIMREAGLIVGVPESNWIIYRITDLSRRIVESLLQLERHVR